MNDNNKNFWQIHTRKYLEMAFRSDHREKLYSADAHGIKTGDCGDTVEFFLMIRDNHIKAVSYDIDGCINTNACANAIIDLIIEKSLNEAWEVTPEDVIEYLGSLPKDNYHCAELASGALYLSLADANQNQREPWKKLYK
jgi:nitrogen fixation NifU-like protein